MPRVGAQPQRGFRLRVRPQEQEATEQGDTLQPPCRCWAPVRADGQGKLFGGGGSVPTAALGAAQPGAGQECAEGEDTEGWGGKGWGSAHPQALGPGTTGHTREPPQAGSGPPRTPHTHPSGSLPNPRQRVLPSPRWGLSSQHGGSWGASPPQALPHPWPQPGLL